MGLSSAIQFRKPEDVLTAFMNRGVDAFSIWCGRQFLFKGMGPDELAQYLDVLNGSDSNATYTLKVYEDIHDVKKIKSNTEDDGSFNFKFNEELHDTYGRIRGMIGTSEGAMTMKTVLDKIEAMGKRLDEMDLQEDEQSPFEKVLDHPLVRQLAPALIGMITGKGEIGLVPGVPEVTNGNEVLEQLHHQDPNLDHHLAKILELAKQDPTSFKQMIKMFD